MLGKGGHDLICGGRGPDILNAMRGRRQRLYGGPGSDFCIAARARDHRYHHGCEVHLPSAPRRSAAARLAPRTAAPPALKRVRTAARRRAAQSAYLGSVDCTHGGIYVSDNSDNPMLLSGGGAGFPDPTTVRVLPYVFSWNGQWVPRGNLDARDFTVPNDGAYYNVGTSWNINENYWLVFYAFGWWDGSQWSWTPYSQVSDYRAFGGFSSGVCVAVA